MAIPLLANQDLTPMLIHTILDQKASEKQDTMKIGHSNRHDRKYYPFYDDAAKTSARVKRYLIS